jgi:MerR family transcriptional regulator/heat shock protein HspR
MADRRTGVRRAARLEVALEEGVFMISVAARLAEMHPQTLRMYESRGLIEPKRSPKGTRLYSHTDVERLRRIQWMTAELGLNLAGVERVLDLESQVARMSARIEALERRALEIQAEMEAEIERVRRSYKAELVPYTHTLDVVRSADARSPFKVPIAYRRTAGGSPTNLQSNEPNRNEPNAS